jgi:hypothetical protein
MKGVRRLRKCYQDMCSPDQGIHPIPAKYKVALLAQPIVVTENGWLGMI